MPIVWHAELSGICPFHLFSQEAIFQNLEVPVPGPRTGCTAVTDTSLIPPFMQFAF